MPRRRRLASTVAIVAGTVALWLWAESVDARAGRRWLGRDISRHPQIAEHSEAVVVLGYGNRGERANFVNRFRVRAGIRSLTPGTDNLLVLCGGTVHSTTPEAVIMQRYARDVLGFTGTIVLDDTSISTRENIANAIPHIEHADIIKIVSNGPHVEKARQLLWQQRPDLAHRLAPGAEHRFGEAPVLKILVALRTVYAKLSGDWVKTAPRPRT